MINISRERVLDSEKSFIDKVYNEKQRTIEKERDSVKKNLSLFEEIKEYDSSKDITYNLVKMTKRDMVRFVLTKNIKNANKLLTGKIDEDKVENFKVNANDYILYQIAQRHNGCITEKALKEYAYENFLTKLERNNFIASTKLRLYTLRSAGCLNDIGKGGYVKYKLNIEGRELKFHARKNVNYQVTHIFKEKLIDLKEEALQYRLNAHEQMILDSFRHFATKEEVIEHMISFYDYDKESREYMLSAQIHKLEHFGYLERVDNTYFTNIGYEFKPDLDYLNQKILLLANNGKLNQNTIEALYEKSNMDIESISYYADNRLAQLKFKGYIDKNNCLSEEGKNLVNTILENMKNKLNNKSSLTVMELSVKGFDRKEYKELLEVLYDKESVDEKMLKVEYILENLKALNFIDNHEKITPEGLMFLERSNYIIKDDQISGIKDLGYLEKQILAAINRNDTHFKSITIGHFDAEKVENICKVNVLNLYSKGYLILQDGKFQLIDKVKDLLYKDNYKITNFDTKNILECSNESVFNKELFWNYQRSIGKNDDEITKLYSMIEKRMEKHIYNGMVLKIGEEYYLTDDFIMACGKNPSTITKEFNLTDYDKNILKLIEKKAFSKEGVIKELREIYGKDAERRYYVMRSRAKALVKEGYVSINDKNFYTLTDKGKAVINNYDYKLSYFDYKTFLETAIDRVFSIDFYTLYYIQRGFSEDEIKKDEAKLRSRLELHLNSGLIERIGENVYFISDKFIEKYKKDYLENKEFSLSKFDKFIFNQADNKVIDIEKYRNELIGLGLDEKAIYNKERMIKNRLLLLEKEGYVTKLDNARYMLTEKHLVKREKTTGERIEIGRFDKKMYKQLKKLGFDKGFTLKDLKDKLSDRDTSFFVGRCVKLYNSGYLIDIQGKLHFSKDFLDKIEEKQKVEKKTIKITRFDVNKIYRCSNNNIIDKTSFEKNYMGKLDTLNKEWNKVLKRLHSLEEQSYVKTLDLECEKFELKSKFLDECREHEKKLIRMKERDHLDLNHEQRFILKELQTFLNISQEQFNMYHDVSNELKNLYDRGILDYQYRIINGKNTKVFYLTSEGKQITSKLTGVKVANIFSSKIHSRPEELEHDVLVYSAFQDTKIRLLAHNKEIVNVKSDRDMRRVLHNSKDYEISDLEIEYVDIMTGEKGMLNIEVDLGYSESVIASKGENIKNLVWYTNSSAQMYKIQKAIPKATVIKL